MKKRLISLTDNRGLPILLDPKYIISIKTLNDMRLCKTGITMTNDYQEVQESQAEVTTLIQKSKKEQ